MSRDGVIWHHLRPGLPCYPLLLVSFLPHWLLHFHFFFSWFPFNINVLMLACKRAQFLVLFYTCTWLRISSSLMVLNTMYTLRILWGVPVFVALIFLPNSNYAELPILSLCWYAQKTSQTHVQNWTPISLSLSCFICSFIISVDGYFVLPVVNAFYS